MQVVIEGRTFEVAQDGLPWGGRVELEGEAWINEDTSEIELYVTCNSLSPEEGREYKVFASAQNGEVLGYYC